MKVLVIPGSLRRDAHTTRLAHAAGELAGDGIYFEYFERLAEIPGFNQDLEHDRIPTPVEDLRDRLGSSDALLIVTPEYNASAPGALKNAIDWASRPHGESALAGLPAAVISASPVPFGGVWANQQIRKAFSVTGTPVVERELAIGKIEEKLDVNGTVTDRETAEQLAAMLLELRDLVESTRESSAVQAAAA